MKQKEIVKLMRKADWQIVTGLDNNTLKAPLKKAINVTGNTDLVMKTRSV